MQCHTSCTVQSSNKGLQAGTCNFCECIHYCLWRNNTSGSWTALVRMWRGKFRCKLNCKLVESSCIHPLLGCKACIGMNIVSYLDNDEINPPAPATTKYTVYTIGKTPEPVETFKKKYPTLFTDGVGCLEGKYPIRPNQNDESVQHAPRRVPVAVCEQLRSTLEQLVQQDMDQFTRNRSKKEWHFMFLPGPKGSQQGHFA